jgi:alpha-galactosidase
MKTQKRFMNNTLSFSLSLIFFITLISCGNDSKNEIALKIEHGKLRLEINNNMRTRISSLYEDAKPIMSDFQASESVSLRNHEISDFSIKNIEQTKLKKEGLKGTEWTISGEYNKGNEKISKQLIIKAYDDFPDFLSFKVTYTNNGKDTYIGDWKNHNYTILSQNNTPDFWVFQGSSTFEREDWVLPIEEGYYKKNYMGMNSTDYGGGIPVTDVWRKDMGIAIGHLELTPQLVALPTELPLGEKNVQINISKDYEYPTLFKKDGIVETAETFVMVHEGDYYNALSKYSNVMQGKGIEFAEPEEGAFETIWCSWGYEENFTLDEIVGTLPKIKELGIEWVVLDYGFQKIEGDWFANPDKFPKGNIEIRQLVDKIHDLGLKAKIWWTPLAASPKSEALSNNPSMRLFNEDWSAQFITFFDIYYLAPVNDIARKHTQEILDLFLKEWDFDGLKMDGMHMNAVPPDYNPDSNLEYPEQAVEGLPSFFQMIYDYSRSIKPNAVVENCPCGACMSFFNMPSMNQAVSSDPTSSWQIRHRGKAYKALIPKMAYYGDHVELSDDASDFASTLGIGGVLGTKFTWPKDNPRVTRLEYQNLLLTTEKEKTYKKWFDLYDELMLSKGQYLGGLYDIGYDKPEGHVVKKDETLYYAFYAEEWDGDIELRGLKDGFYEVHDYINDISYGKILGKDPVIKTFFNGALLLSVKSVSN